MSRGFTCCWCFRKMYSVVSQGWIYWGITKYGSQGAFCSREHRYLHQKKEKIIKVEG